MAPCTSGSRCLTLMTAVGSSLCALVDLPSNIVLAPHWLDLQLPRTEHSVSSGLIVADLLRLRHRATPTRRVTSRPGSETFLLRKPVRPD